MTNQAYAHRITPLTTTRHAIKERNDTNFVKGIQTMFEHITLFDGMSVSFHHHLRNGDYWLNEILLELEKRNIKNITLVASSLFDVHQKIIPLIKNQTITKIYAAYVSKKVGEVISEGYLKDGLVMHTHGYRALMLTHHLVSVDVAFIVASASDKQGNASGSLGKTPCGVLGYAIADAQSAQQVVILSDSIVPVDKPEIHSDWVDVVCEVDSIGDASGIVSGTTQITKDPIGLKIAQLAVDFCEAANIIKENMSFQSGAGGISLAVMDKLHHHLKNKNIKALFASGGTTKLLVDMLEDNTVSQLYDVQCFDLDAIQSLAINKNHKKMSAMEYADITYKDNIANKLDVVFLGATEIDLDFNVNVTTGSDGIIMGGSGGHADVANGAKMTIIVSKLMQSRLSVVVDKVTTISTPSEDIDCFVCEFGLALHPRHQALADHLKKTTNLPIKDIRELYDLAISLTGIPNKIAFADQKIGVSLYRDGSILDELYAIASV